MYCPVCFAVLQVQTSPKLPCGCYQCADCLTQWIITQTKELHYQTYEKIPCMNAHCRQPFKAEDVTSFLNQEQRETINTALFDVYLRKTEDIRMCPNNNCFYAGMINLNAPCGDNLECESCGRQWREKIHLSAKEKVKEFFGENNTKRSEVLCELWEEIFTRRCPSCGVSIQKSGGCDHMTCRKCQFEFCWLCALKFQEHNNKFCAASFIAKVLMLLFTLVNVFYMLGIVQIGIGLLGWFIRFTMKCAILNALAIGTYFFMALLKKKRRKSLYFVGFLLILLVFVINYFKLYLSLINVGLIEACVLGLVTLYEKKMKIWLYSIY